MKLGRKICVIHEIRFRGILLKNRYAFFLVGFGENVSSDPGFV